MQRLIRLSLFSILLGILSVGVGFAQNKHTAFVSGSIKPSDVRIFQKDTIYIINNDYVVGGTLIIEPGTEIHFQANGRLIDSTGGRIIADGFAKASYTASPNGVNPVVQYEPLGYASFDYFFLGAVNQYNDNSAAARTVKIETPKEPTVHNDKYNYIFNVVLDKSTRKVVNLVDPTAYAKERNSASSSNPNHIVVSYEQALMFYAARLNNDPENFDPNLKTLPWKRIGNSSVNSVNIVPEPIVFVGKPAGNFSREWGHIIVLPGARAAFFRNVEFRDIRKDTTVDRQNIYKLPGVPYANLNNRLNKLTNGSGGAITTLSSRTWVIDAKFINNMARNRGGALNILQAPQEFQMFRGSYTTNDLAFYPNDKNPSLTNKDGSPSIVNTNTVLRIDNIDESLSAFPEPLTDEYRQAFDDGRTAVLLGRFRRLHFDRNYVQLAHTTISQQRTFDDTTRAAVHPYSNGNHAQGGAIYISGVIEYKERLVEVGFGVNNSIKTAGGEVFFPNPDFFIATGNEARNYQNSPDSEGARGGAIYGGNYTSLIVAGEFTNNKTKAKYFDDEDTFGEKVFLYSQGGAIFTENTLGRLQLRGGPSRENTNPTYFTGNTAGAGGALFVDGNASDWESPVIGGSDQTLTTRDYGFDIKFENNSALTFGGAILTKRNFSINGAGGVAEDLELGYDGKYSIRFWNNDAGFSGGAIDIRIPSAIPPLPPFKRAVQIVRAEFIGNTVGENVAERNLTEIRGGGAIYSYNGDIRLVKGTDFVNNTVYHGNGGALSIVNLQDANAKKFFLSDLDHVDRDAFGMPVSYHSHNGVFTGEHQAYPADVRMLTRFINNKILNPNTEWFESQLGNGATMDGFFVNRRNKDSKLPENGIGLGGAIYILDSVSVTKASRLDSMNFNRVRIQNNESFTGSALYSDNYNLKLIFNRSLISGNLATSTIGMEQNVITGPLQMDNGGTILANRASSDLTATTIYGEIQGPLPSYIFSEAANSIFNNSARFLIRLPDAPNTKGLNAGTTGIGYGGTDTLRGNYWGHTEANVNLWLPHLQDNVGLNNIESFFVAGDGNNWLPMIYPELINNNPADRRQKGPFESVERQDITYLPIEQKNAADENTADAMSIPENLLFNGHIYDIYDKSTDIKTADYSKRRMSPIEDFAVGIPPKLRLFNDPNQPSYNKVVKRWVRDPYYAELRDDNGNLAYPGLAAVQTEFRPDELGVYYHPIGYPLFLETNVNYDGLTRTSNHDPLTKNESVFFVINLKTGDYVRANLSQVDENAPYRETFRRTIELVPDSTLRTDPTWRRTSEGLANLGSGPELLANLFRNAKNEDYATLQGRRYTADDNALARVTNLYSNRPAMPVSNLIGTTSNTTYYAGERFNSLPVRVGDSVLIVSRTILWREGIHNAATKGMAFRITESTRPPVWTGNIISIQRDTVKNYLPSEENPNTKEEVIYTEFLNKVFLTEDRTYPVAFRTYSGLDRYGDPNGEIAGGQGRDSIITITAIDSNRFYDPRSFLEPTGYARLDYSWETNTNSALSRWLVVRKKYASDPVVFGANGYLELAGMPINPFVVPGGDSITVIAKNYPPHYRNVDNLKAMNPAVSQDEIDRWVETYPGYFSNPMYDVDNARFLQQDTIDVGPNHETRHTFKIFVVDSLPRFLEPGDDYTINRIDDPSQVYVDAKGTVLTCATDRNGKLIANLTNKLRFQIDINTDDEWEDKSPAAQGWDFRYGRTAYGFANYAIRQNPGDTSVLDLIDYELDQSGLEGSILVQSRPNWMKSQYLTKYDTDNDADLFATDFTTHGQLNIRIPAEEALGLLTPKNQQNGAYNTDTTFTVVVNDGHGGINTRKYEVFINIVPTIVNDTLPFAIEDRDYNPSLLDITRQIHVSDPNFGQKHTYRLIYPSTTQNSIPIDACYADAGVIDLTNIKTTPEWLKINTNTGMLYGMPKVKDAPKSEVVTVVVTDENGLSTMKRLNLTVNGVQHNPEITGIPAIECIDENSSYSTKIKIVDTDLNRTNPSETITLELVDENGLPINGLRITPSTFTGNGNADNFEATITKVGALNPTNGNWLVVNVVATDRYGNKARLTYRLTISEPTDFTATIRVENVKGSYQDLVFGTSSVTGTSTGDGNDNDYVGKIDEDLCEYELPPRPYDDAFDARWTITNRNGVLRNIFPTARPNTNNNFIYKGRFQAGGVSGGSSPLYPVTLTWKPSEIPAVNDGQKNPAGSSWWLKDRFSDGNVFVVNMRDPSKAAYNSQVTLSVSGDEATLTILDDGIDQFVIMHDWTSNVEDLGLEATGTKITAVSPNPVNTNSSVEFEVLQSSRVTLQVVDMLGNVVATLVNDDLRSGKYNVDWNAADANGNRLANGQYMLRLVAGNATSTYPVVVVK